MRLTEAQLRRIIREETVKSLGRKQNSKYSLRSLFEAGTADVEVTPTTSETQPETRPEMDATKVDWNSNYEDFVQALKSNAADVKVKAFIAAGKFDQDENDDKFSFKNISLPVTELRPTQNEIDVNKSLAYPIGQPATFLGYVKGSGQSFALGNPIVTFNGKYIIDGHHRWSQLYACNKDTSIDAIDITAPGLKPLDVLKAVQAAIAYQLGRVPTQKVTGDNLLDFDESMLKGWFDKFAGKAAFLEAVAADPDAVSEMQAVVGGSAPAGMKPEQLSDLVVKYIGGNVKSMKKTSQPVAGAPKRDFMPQTDDATKNLDWRIPLEAGIVDINQPRVQPPTKSESRHRNNGAVIVERWQRLAGLLK